VAILSTGPELTTTSALDSMLTSPKMKVKVSVPKTAVIGEVLTKLLQELNSAVFCLTRYMEPTLLEAMVL